MTDDERWMPVLGFEGFYEVSSHGRVRSFDRYVNHWRGGQRLVSGRILTTFPTDRDRPRSYLRVGLYRPGTQRAIDVHIVVLEAFVGPRPHGMVCCHYNGDSRDNRLENLRWDTPSANSLDDIRNGVHPAASKTRCKREHEFTPENTYIRAGIGRYCRTCQRDNGRRWELAARAVRIRDAAIRHCRDCGDVISPEKKSEAVYCSTRCRQRAWQAAQQVGAMARGETS